MDKKMKIILTKEEVKALTEYMGYSLDVYGWKKEDKELRAKLEKFLGKEIL